MLRNRSEKHNYLFVDKCDQSWGKQYLNLEKVENKRKTTDFTSQHHEYWNSCINRQGNRA